MSPEYPTDPRQALEASLTALLLGELPPDQVQFLREALIRDAELARIHERLRQTIELVKQVESKPVAAAALPTEELRLNEDKREKLLQHFKTAALPQLTGETVEPSRSGTSPWLLAAAAVVVFLMAVSMLLPALSRAKSKGLSFAAHAPASSAAVDAMAPSPPALHVAQLAERQLHRSPVVTGISPGQNRGIPKADIVLPADATRRGEALSVALTDESGGDRASKTWADYDEDGFTGLFANAGRGNFLSHNDDKAAGAGAPELGVAMKFESAPESRPPAAVEAPVARFGAAFTPVTPPPPSPAAARPPDTAAREARPTENFKLGYPVDQGGLGGVAAAGGMGGGRPESRPEPLFRKLENVPMAASRRRYSLSATPQPQAGAGMIEKEMAGARVAGLPLAEGESVVKGLAVDPATGLPVKVDGSDFQVLLPSQEAVQASVRGFAAGAYVATNVLADGRTGGAHPDQAFTWHMANERFSADARALGEQVKSPTLGDTPALGRVFFDEAQTLPQAQEQAGKKVAGQDSFFRSLPQQGLRTSGGMAQALSEGGPAPARGTLVEMALKEVPSLKVAEETFGQSLAAGKERVAAQNDDKAPASTKTPAPATGDVKDREEARIKLDSAAAGRVAVPRVSVAGGVPARGKAKVEEVAPAQVTASLDAALPKPATPPPVPQPEVLTAENAFSTFSLNVSDVSFKLAAASLEKGVLPDAGSIRSEEFINAFDYRDPEPTPGMPLGFASERARFPFAQNRDLLRFSLKTAAQGRPTGRPLNLVLLVDNSGSMERSDRVSILREALRVLAAQLQPQDKLSVIAFSLTPHLWADGLPGTDVARVAEEVANLTPQGGTNLEEAMKLAYKTAARHYLPNGINRVVILTDGAANLGNVDPDGLKKSVEEHRQQGIALDCFGIGWEGYNDDLLEVLSRNGDGRYGFLNTREEATTEFAGQLAGALRVAASDVKVQVEFNPRRVTAYRQIGYAKHQLTKEQFRDNTVDAAEIGAAESGNALYVVEVNPQGEGPLATVRARYKVPGTSDYFEHEWTVAYTGSAPPLESASPALRLAAAASGFSEWLAASPYAATVTPGALINLLRGVPQVYGADARPQKLEWMIRQANSLAGR